MHNGRLVHYISHRPPYVGIYRLRVNVFFFLRHAYKKPRTTCKNFNDFYHNVYHAPSLYLPTRAGHRYVTITYVYKSNKRDCFKGTRRRIANGVYCCYRPVCPGLAWRFSIHVCMRCKRLVRTEIALRGHVVSKTRTTRFRLRSESKIANAIVKFEPRSISRSLSFPIGVTVYPSGTPRVFYRYFFFCSHNFFD